MQSAFCFYAGRGWGLLPCPAACVAFMQARDAHCMCYLLESEFLQQVLLVYVDKIRLNVDLCCIIRIYFVPL